MALSDDNLVVIRRFSRDGEAQIVKSMLDSFGIETQLRGDTAAGLFPDNPISDFSIELVARSEDADRIEELLTAGADGNETGKI